VTLWIWLYLTESLSTIVISYCNRFSDTTSHPTVFHSHRVLTYGSSSWKSTSPMQICQLSPRPQRDQALKNSNATQQPPAILVLWCRNSTKNSFSALSTLRQSSKNSYSGICESFSPTSGNDTRFPCVYWRLPVKCIMSETSLRHSQDPDFLP
jgi:hypothetical protein